MYKVNKLIGIKFSLECDVVKHLIEWDGRNVHDNVTFRNVCHWDGRNVHHNAMLGNVHHIATLGNIRHIGMVRMFITMQC